MKGKTYTKVYRLAHTLFSDIKLLYCTNNTFRTFLASFISFVSTPYNIHYFFSRQDFKRSCLAAVLCDP